MVQPVIDETHCVDGEVTDNCVDNADSTVSSIASCEPVTETELQTDSQAAVATELGLSANSEALAAEQTNDTSLSDCRALARAKKGGFE